MADADIRIVAHAIGFEEVAARAKAAAESFRRMNETMRASSARFEKDLAGAFNGARLGATLGADISKGLAASLARTSTTSTLARAFEGMHARFRAAGQQLGRSLAAGITLGMQSYRNNPMSHTDLYGGIIAGGMAAYGLESAADAAGRREQARLNLRDTGLVSSAQMRTLEGLARSWRERYRNLSTTEGLGFLKDQLQILGGPDHLFAGHGRGDALTADARKGMNRIAGLMSYMKTLHGGEHAGQAMNVASEFADAVRSAEIFGRGTNIEAMADWVSRLTKISLATGVSPSQFLSAQRTAGASFFALDDTALGIFAAYVQENKQRAGVQLMTSFMHLVGGNNQRGRGNRALQQLGLLPNNPTDLRRLAKLGKVKLDKNGDISMVNDMSILKDYQKNATNPYRWAAEDLYPAIREKIKRDKGYDIGDIGTPLTERSKNAIVDVMQSIGGVFSQRNEATQAVEAIVQYSMLLKRADNILKANADTDARRESYLAKVQALATSWDDLKVALGETVLPSIKGVLDTARVAMKSMQEFAQSHPTAIGAGLKYGGGFLAAAGGLAVARLAWTHLFRFPLQILKSVGLAVTGGLVGIFGAASKMFGGLVGINTKFGDVMAKGRLSGLAARLTRFAEAIPGLARVMGIVGRIGSLLFGPIGTIASGVYAWTSSTDSGSAWWRFVKDYWTYTKHKLGGADRKTLDADIARLRKSNATANTKLYGLIDDAKGYLGLGEDSQAEKLKRIMRWRNEYAWMHKYNYPMKNEPYGPFRAPSYLGLGDAMPSFSRKHVRATLQASRREGANSGPVPVVVQSMPKGQDRPTSIVVNNTINVTAAGLGAIGAAIAGAVGPATASSVSNALSDGHH